MDTFGQFNFQKNIPIVIWYGGDLETQGDEDFWESGLIGLFKLLILLDRSVRLRLKVLFCL